uniref:RING-type domain-containing protein n=1 Tax=Peronospora matthiolae TaxID=2874970 RepID=A0AAV1TQL7_9STRA
MVKFTPLFLRFTPFLKNLRFILIHPTRELGKYTKPTRLYPSCPWELKIARRLIVDRKLAPRFHGKEMQEEGFTFECPICFMLYPGSLNTSSCCKKPICSKCYLQIRPPRKTISCPLCNHEGFTVLYTPLTPTELTSTHSVTNGTSPRRSSAIGIPKATEKECTMTSSLQSVQYASVEDHDRMRDSLRLQLSISDKLVTSSPHPNRVAALNDAAFCFATTPADAARLEELMLLEAIRRSMQDISVEKTTRNEGNGRIFGYLTT